MKKYIKDIYTRTYEFINKYGLVSSKDNILLALSAGKDSMALLDILQYLKSDLSVNLGIFHLNHMMRGKESDDDEIFITGIARKHELPIFSHKFDFKKNKHGGFSFEEFAREKRYELLDKICRENNFNKIATAHNQNDNIETILMRIFTGTGINGLRGIDIKRNNIIRPLLFLSAAEIYDHLAEKKISWREDSSNRDDKYLRNYVRNSLLPAIAERFERAGDSILSLSNIAGEYTAIIHEYNSQKEIIEKQEDNSIVIDLEKINDKKLFKFAVADAISKSGNFVTGGVLEEVYKNAMLNKTHLQLYKTGDLLIRKTLKNRKKVIVISQDIKYYDNDWEYKISLQSIDKKIVLLKEINRSITFNIADYEYFLKHQKEDIVFIAVPEDAESLFLRNRRKGDRINQKYGIKKVKELMIDCKLDRLTKESVPFIVIDEAVAAIMPEPEIMPARVSVDFYVNENTKKILAIHSDRYHVTL